MRSLPIYLFALRALPEAVEPAVCLFRNRCEAPLLFDRHQLPVAAERAAKRPCIPRKIEYSCHPPDLALRLFAPQHHNGFGRPLLKPPVAGKAYAPESAPGYDLIVRYIVSVVCIEPQQPQILRDLRKMNVAYKPDLYVDSFNYPYKIQPIGYKTAR